MSVMRLAEVHVYPLKGARGITLQRAEVLRGGLRHDRRLLLLDAKGAFLTQRTHPTLALVATSFDVTTSEAAATSLTFDVPGVGSATIALTPEGSRRDVRIWDDDVAAVDVSGAAQELLSEHLGERCSLVFMPDDVVRPVESPYGASGDRVGFADAYPVLLATRASLADLNTRLDESVPMDRFRPNLVVEGGEAFEEDRYGRAAVGALSFRMPKRCARCVVVLVDQATGIPGKEPLRTLATYRSESNKVYFAQNLIPDGEGWLAVGDEVRYADLLPVSA